MLLNAVQFFCFYNDVQRFGRFRFQDPGKIYSALHACMARVPKEKLGVNFTNILRTAFSHESFARRFLALIV